MVSYHIQRSLHLLIDVLIQLASPDSLKLCNGFVLKLALVTAALSAALLASPRCTTRGGKENTTSWCALSSCLQSMWHAWDSSSGLEMAISQTMALPSSLLCLRMRMRFLACSASLTCNRHMLSKTGKAAMLKGPWWRQQIAGLGLKLWRRKGPHAFVSSTSQSEAALELAQIPHRPALKCAPAS